MRRLRPLAVLHLLLLACVLLTGCGRPAIVDRRPIAPVDARPASLLAPMLPMTATAEDASFPGTPARPWYYDRNDYGPSVVRGTQTPIVERVETWTYDRQSSSHGEVRDRYHQTTRRQRVYQQTW